MVRFRDDPEQWEKENPGYSALFGSILSMSVLYGAMHAYLHDKIVFTIAFGILFAMTLRKTMINFKHWKLERMLEKWEKANVDQ